MISADDVADIVLQTLRENRPGSKNFRESLSEVSKREGRWGFYAAKPFNKSYTSLPAKRIFLSEYDIKKLLRPSDQKLQVPKLAIISPLAQEWLETKQIVVEFR